MAYNVFLFYYYCARVLYFILDFGKNVLTATVITPSIFLYMIVVIIIIIVIIIISFLLLIQGLILGNSCAILRPNT